MAMTARRPKSCELAPQMTIETACVASRAFDILEVCNGIARGPRIVEAALLIYDDGLPASEQDRWSCSGCAARSSSRSRRSTSVMQSSWSKDGLTSLSDYLADTSVWNGATWAEESPTFSPFARGRSRDGV